ncbi:hypothetical protein ABEB36_002267 [Hypothenemus hampei]|uniref:Activating signal cointegrator 1 n=1 Tax=Hypothenemus hampei TaxID=57062 RepID=A0ABD1F548_HYPHA
MTNNQQIFSHLKDILGGDVEPNIIAYISSMKQEEDYEEFMDSIIKKRNAAHIKAYNAIKYLLFGNKLKNKNKNLSDNMTSNSGRLSQNQASSSGKQKTDTSSNTSQGKKGKKKFRDIQNFEDKKEEERGRHPCDCLGQEHEFMNNCLHCGRIHCMKEGPGPCLYCGNEIHLKGEIQNPGNAKPLTKLKLNKVFDDDNDYFKVNSKKSNGDKAKMIVALDFASRKVIETTQGDMKLKQMLLEDSMKHLEKVKEVYKKIQRQGQRLFPKHNKDYDELVDLLVQMRHKKPTEPEELGEEDNKMPIIKYETNVMDEDLIINVDQGLCLSMHQPYASLLVAGVKRHEGRVWSTNHRGRLWIAAAAKPAEEDEIEVLENFYRDFYKGCFIYFKLL